MATRIRKQWLDLTYSPTGLTADDINHSDTTTVKSAIDGLYNKIAYRTLTVTKSGTGTGTVTSSPAGINCGSTCSYQFAFGTNVTLTATPDSGSAFGGWSGNVTGSSSTIIITIDSNKSVISTFNTLYTLTVIKSGTGAGTITSSPDGIDCGATCSYQFVSGTSVTLTATPDSSSVFSGWSGDVTCSCSTIIVTMDSNKSVTTTFNALYLLTVTKSGAGTGTVTSFPSGIDCGSTCSYQFVSGTNVTLIATPDSSFTFDGWSGDVTGTNPIIIVTMTSNKNVTATFNIYNKAGYFAGGWNENNQKFIDKLLFSNESRSTLTATLSRSVSNHSACNSLLAGYFAGGGNQSFIDKLLFSDETRSTLTATLSLPVDDQSACNSTLAGYFAAGGNNDGEQSFIDKLLFSDDSRTTLTAILSQSVGYQSACNSISTGYFAGGINSISNYQSFIDKLLFSNESRTTLTAILSQTIYAQSACNSISAGYFAGGDNGSYQNYIDKLLFNNESRSTLATTLSQNVYAQSACNSTSAGYFAGGNIYNNHDEIYYYQSFIDKLLFSNETRSTLTVTLSQSIDHQSACQSGGIL
jgi:uncharacterized repeat protein (TIGR02543 family)